METEDRITVLEETIQNIDNLTILENEDKNKIINEEQIPDYETWEKKDVKRQLFEELGRLTYIQYRTKPTDPSTNNPTDPEE